MSVWINQAIWFGFQSLIQFTIATTYIHVYVVTSKCSTLHISFHFIHKIAKCHSLTRLQLKVIINANKSSYRNHRIIRMLAPFTFLFFCFVPKSAYTMRQQTHQKPFTKNKRQEKNGFNTWWLNKFQLRGMHCKFLCTF